MGESFAIFVKPRYMLLNESVKIFTKISSEKMKMVLAKHPFTCMINYVFYDLGVFFQIPLNYTWDNQFTLRHQ